MAGQMEQWLWPALTLVVGLFTGSYLKSYIGKKGENLATHEDIQKLVDQVKAVTQATKEIEAKISDDVWNRQKRWEVKKEALFDYMRELGGLEDALSTFGSTQLAIVQSGESADAPHWIDRRVEAVEKWTKCSLSYSQAEMRAILVSGQETRNIIHGVGVLLRTLVKEVFAGKPRAYFESLPQIAADLQSVTIAVRRELGIEESGIP